MRNNSHCKNLDAVREQVGARAFDELPTAADSRVNLLQRIAVESSGLQPTHLVSVVHDHHAARTHTSHACDDAHMHLLSGSRLSSCIPMEQPRKGAHASNSSSSALGRSCRACRKRAFAPPKSASTLSAGASAQCSHRPRRYGKPRSNPSRFDVSSPNYHAPIADI